VDASKEQIKVGRARRIKQNPTKGGVSLSQMGGSYCLGFVERAKKVEARTLSNKQGKEPTNDVGWFGDYGKKGKDRRKELKKDVEKGSQ